jgi:hypothetical protein
MAFGATNEPLSLIRARLCFSRRRKLLRGIFEHKHPIQQFSLLGWYEFAFAFVRNVDDFLRFTNPRIIPLGIDPLATNLVHVDVERPANDA